MSKSTYGSQNPTNLHVLMLFDPNDQASQDWVKNNFYLNDMFPDWVDFEAASVVGKENEIQAHFGINQFPAIIILDKNMNMVANMGVGLPTLQEFKNTVQSAVNTATGAAHPMPRPAGNDKTLTYGILALLALALFSD